MSLKNYIEHTNLVKKWEDGFFPDYNNFYADKFFEDEFITNKFGNIINKYLERILKSVKINAIISNNTNNNDIAKIRRANLSSFTTLKIK